MLPFKRASIAGLLAGGLLIPGPVFAQQSVALQESPVSADSSRDSGTAVRSDSANSLTRLSEDSPTDSLGENEWVEPQANLPRALLGVSAVNALAIGINVLWRDEPSTHPGSWWDNINGGWEWDPNPIRVNSFEHPWAGAAYYNVARANGLSVYAAMPVTLFGSLMWEVVGEPRPPSTNDLVTTTLGGVALGEPLFLLSLEVLDNQATGFDRFWREAAVFVFNPGLGLNRLTRGQSWSAGPNSPARGKVPIRGRAAFGAVRLAPADGHQGEDANAGMLRFDLAYGNPFETADRGPLSSFEGALEFSSLSAVLTRLSVRGLLTPLGSRQTSSDHLTGLFLDFDYRWDNRVGFAEQSFGLGLLSKIGGDQWQVHTDLSGELVPLLASTDRWSDEAIDRYYEYGSGVGGRAAARLQHRQTSLLSASLRAYWTVTLNGASSTKLIQLAEVEARTPRLGPLSLGANLRLYRQTSDYPDRITGSESMSSVSIFVSTAY